MKLFSLETFLLGVLSLMREVTSSRGSHSCRDIRVSQKAFYNPNHWAPSPEPVVQGSGPGPAWDPGLLFLFCFVLPVPGDVAVREQVPHSK